MKFKHALAGVQALLLLASCSAVAGSETLEVFAQSGMTISQGDRSGITYTVGFQRDGLLHSYAEVSSSGTVIRSFQVRRDGDDITPIYTANNLISWIERIHLSNGILSLKTSKMREGDIFEVRAVKDASGNATRYAHVFNGTVSVNFEFNSSESRLEYPQRGQSFRFSIGPDRTPVVEATAADADAFETVPKSIAQFETTVRASDGLVIARYKIKGLPRKSDPLIAIANFELITGGPDLSPVLFAFVGGSPE